MEHDERKQLGTSEIEEKYEPFCFLQRWVERESRSLNDLAIKHSPLQQMAFQDCLH